MVTRKGLLNESGVEWCTHNCNHYVGCFHNCQYPCYARKLSNESEIVWISPRVVENALELAVHEIRNLPKGSKIMVSSVTDPYQPIEKTEKLTRALIPVLASRDDVTVIIITKSNLVQRDFELIKEFPNIHLCMSITSMQDIPLYEPNAPGNTARISCLKEAFRQGIYTIASIEPWIPSVTKPQHIVQEIWPFTKEVFIGSLNWHFRRGSEQERQAIREYTSFLPFVTKFLEDHLIKVTVKKELRALTERSVVGKQG